MCSPGQLSGSYAMRPKAIWDKFGSERLSICTETSNRLSKRVITSPKLGPKLSELTSEFKITVFYFVPSFNKTTSL